MKRLILAPILAAATISAFGSGSIRSTGAEVRPFLDRGSPLPLEPALMYLSSGNASWLATVNCSKRFELKLRGSRGPAGELNPALRGVLDSLTLAAKTLAWISQTGSRSTRRDRDWQLSLLAGVLESEPKLRRAVLAMGSPPALLQAIRSKGTTQLDEPLPQGYHTWYKGLMHVRERESRGRRAGNASQSSRVKHEWFPPFLDCELGRYTSRWQQPLLVPLHTSIGTEKSQLRGLVWVDVDLQELDIDQCSTDWSWHQSPHECPNYTQCVPHRGHGFRLGAYKCVCHPGYYNATSSVDGSTAVRCIPCAPGCPNCKDSRPCEAKPHPALRITLISVQLVCVLLILLGMTVVHHGRKNKSVRSSGIILLEFLLFGSLLLSFPVFILYFDPSVFRCIALRWVRLLGFAIVYGIIILKLHRVLKVFLARTAQRLPYLTSGRMLRVLVVILLVVVWFLVAWTMATWHNLSFGISLLEHNSTYSGLRFLYCRLEYWDYMLSLAEFLFLCWGLYLCYAVRTVPSVYHEPWYMTGAIINEMFFSLIFHILQFTMTSRMHPDWMLLAVFIHTHLTVSVTVGLLLIPKFACGSSAPRDDIAVEPYEDELDVMRRSGSYLNSSITSAWSEHSVDPDDLRDELKRLYAQLEFYKGQKMLINNPHLQKKRSLKKGLGRSIMRRITELPDNVTRRDDRERCDSRGSSGAGTPHTPCSSKRPSADHRPRDEHFHQQLQQSQANHRPFILPKSYSSYDQLLEQPELGPASERSEENTVAAEMPQVPGEAAPSRPSSLDKAESDSLDSVPLVCRSASAHNLSAANKRPAQHPARPSLLQKSLSLISGARERTLAHGSKACSMEDGHDEMAWKDLASGDSVSCGKMKTLAEHHILTENTVHAQGSSLRTRPGETTWNQQQQQKRGSSEEKHSCVTFADSPQANNDEYDREEVCPWEFQDLPSTTQHASGEGQKPQKHVSIAPDSIKEHNDDDGPLRAGQSKTTKKQRSLSDPNREVEEAEALPGSLSSVVEEMQESEDPMNTQLISPPTEPKPPSKTDVCPWEIQDVPESTTDDRGQAACTGITDTKGQKANLADICPWEMEDEIPSSSRSNSPGELKMSEKLASEKMTNGSHTKPKQHAKGFGFNFKNLVNIGRKKADHGQKGSSNDKAVLPLTQTQKQVNVPKEAKE